ncbi:hypothetical protein D3C86_2164000 [compost metagenome]
MAHGGKEVGFCLHSLFSKQVLLFEFLVLPLQAVEINKFTILLVIAHLHHQGEDALPQKIEETAFFQKPKQHILTADI